MIEERKFAILFAATILAERRLIDLDPDKPTMAKGFFVDRAIDDAVFILERIDERWPSLCEHICDQGLSQTLSACSSPRVMVRATPRFFRRDDPETPSL